MGIRGVTILLAVLREVGAYLTVYPLIVGVHDCVDTDAKINDVLVNKPGFHIDLRQDTSRNLNWNILQVDTLSTLQPLKALINISLSNETPLLAVD